MRPKHVMCGPVYFETIPIMDAEFDRLEINSDLEIAAPRSGNCEFLSRCPE